MNLRKAVRNATLASWQAQGPARIDSPLKQVRELFPGTRNEDGTTTPHFKFVEARAAANAGQGHVVTRIAREGLRK